jgi:hypothetical protein
MYPVSPLLIIEADNFPPTSFQFVERAPEADCEREFCDEAATIAGPEEAFASFFEAHRALLMENARHKM